eukprot:4310951-Pleurochrysis_carterae.AAC.1
MQLALGRVPDKVVKPASASFNSRNFMHLGAFGFETALNDMQLLRPYRPVETALYWQSNRKSVGSPEAVPFDSQNFRHSASV